MVKSPKKFFRLKNSGLKFSWVLFDYDGVIGDTMEDNYASWRQAFKKYGVGIRRKEYFLLEGYGAKNIARILGQKHKVPASYFSRILADKESYYFNHNRFRLFDGVQKAIKRLKNRKVVLGIISGASRVRLLKTLPANILKQFSVVVTPELIKRTKPYPDPYLQGIKLLGADPKRTLVIENAPLGIKSAKLAHLYCLAVATTLPKIYLREADLIVGSMEDVIKLIK